MVHWRDLVQLDTAVQILPWIPSPRRSLSLAEAAWSFALSTLVLACVYLIDRERRLNRLGRWMLARHLVFRAPFYSFVLAVLPGMPRPAGV